MWAILQRAFGVKGDQFVDLPEWTRDQKFDIVANVPEGATKEQFQDMLQNLLKDRLNLASHWSKKEIDAYTLTVAKGGPKLKPAAPANPADGPPPRTGMQMGTPTLDQDGFSQLRPGYQASMGHTDSTGTLRMTFRSSSPANLAGALSRGVFPLVDATGLTGPYDFKLEYDVESFIALLPGFHPPPPDRPRSDAPDIFTALESQLGLKLEKGKAQIDVVVIDHLDRQPAEN
jgi:uncharacterized protein (TIGR03435 family)